MKTILSFAEVLLAIPLGILSIPLLVGVFVVKAFRGSGAPSTVISMDTQSGRMIAKSA